MSTLLKSKIKIRMNQSKACIVYSFDLIEQMYIWKQKNNNNSLSLSCCCCRWWFFKNQNLRQSFKMSHIFCFTNQRSWRRRRVRVKRNMEDCFFLLLKWTQFPLQKIFTTIRNLQKNLNSIFLQQNDSLKKN